jgi:acyl carrier protein
MADSMEKDILKLVSEVIEIPEADIKPEADFANDLGVDSMKAIEIVAAVEKKYKVLVPEKDIPGIRTLNGVIEMIKSLKKA